MLALAAFVVFVFGAIYAWVATAPEHLWSVLFIGLALLALHFVWAIAVPQFNRPPAA